MAIVSSSLQTQKGIIFGSGFLNSGGGRGYFSQFAVPWQLCTMLDADTRASFPYGMGIRGYFEALETGGIRAISRNNATVTATVIAEASLSAVATGNCSISVSVWQGIQISATATGNCIVSAQALGAANIQARLVIGASPSTIDIADAVWGRLSSAYTTSGNMAYELKRAKEQAEQSLKTGQFLALK